MLSNSAAARQLPSSTHVPPGSQHRQAVCHGAKAVNPAAQLPRLLRERRDSAHFCSSGSCIISRSSTPSVQKRRRVTPCTTGRTGQGIWPAGKVLHTPGGTHNHSPSLSAHAATTPVACTAAAVCTCRGTQGSCCLHMQLHAHAAICTCSCMHMQLYARLLTGVDTSSKRMAYPTSCPSRQPISSATRAATVMAATRRGCVHATMRPPPVQPAQLKVGKGVISLEAWCCRKKEYELWLLAQPAHLHNSTTADTAVRAPASCRYCGSCVVLPLPVSPTTTVVAWASTKYSSCVRCA